MSIPSPAPPRIAVPDRLDPGALTATEPGASMVDLGGATMGTTWRVRLALRPGHDSEALRAALQARLDGIVDEMSHWEAASILSRFNRSPPGSWTALPPDFAQVITSALEVAEKSGGAFDPALGRLTDAWGLGPNPPRDLAPHDAARLLAQCGWNKLAYDAQAGRLRQPGGLWLDLSGIAKGFAADALAGMLAAQGIRHALVEIGGEFAGRGMRPDGDPWWVDLETPPGVDLAPLRIALHQLGLATSGDYLRGAHTIDPTSGLPAIHQTTSVSVVHDSCMNADAWASALLVLRPEHAKALAERERLAVRLIERSGDEWLSPAFLRML